MERQEALDQITGVMGEVPEWLGSLPGDALVRRWSDMLWMNSDTGLTSREKKLVAFGAAAAIHCTY